jgi:hypothetical protein
MISEQNKLISSTVVIVVLISAPVPVHCAVQAIEFRFV